MGTDLALVAISREIDSPGEFYDEAIRIMYWAARHRLNENEEEPDRESGWAIAVAFLRNQGFQIIQLTDFMKIRWSPTGKVCHVHEAF